jgi:pyruvate/2-oxoglutarate dehydrogenase complex dihydrolipoamide acyltransferase (E2) component
MPIFKRSDGDLVKDESPVRIMIPYLMKGRNESVVYHDEVIDMTKLRPWIHAFNQAHPDNAITLFHVVLYCIARGFHSRPALNRFVSGGNIYQRKKVELSFAAKRKMEEKSALVTVKVEFPAEETFPEMAKRIKSLISEGRGPKERGVDKEVRLLTKLPGPVLRAAVAVARWLDSVNLMPKTMIDTDPMYCSAFVANLGSIGVDRTYHHLYEWGNASLFAVLGVPKKVPVVVKDEVVVRELVEVRWSFDERINDGFTCALGMKYAARLLEDPDRWLGPPTTAEKIPGQVMEVAS